jgi:hypothetical protein
MVLLYGVGCLLILSGKELVSRICLLIKPFQEVKVVDLVKEAAIEKRMKEEIMVVVNLLMEMEMEVVVVVQRSLQSELKCMGKDYCYYCFHLFLNKQLLKITGVVYCKDFSGYKFSHFHIYFSNIVFIDGRFLTRY